MDTTNDTKMQPATDAVIEELRKMQPAAWCYEDMLGRKCVGFERPLHRRNTHEALFSAADHAVIMGLVTRLEAAERDVARKEKVIDALGSGLNAVAKERDELRAKIEAMERQEPGFRERCTPSAPTGCSNRFPLYALPGAKGEEE